MNLIIMDQSYKFVNKPESVPVLLSTVEDILEKNNMILSHFVIDGLEIYENFEDYILDNIDYLNVVSAELRTLKEWLDEMVNSALEYLKRSIPALEQLGTEFYQGSDKESWLKFDQMMEGIGWLSQLVDQITQHDVLSKSWERTEQDFELQGLLLELEDAVLNKDTVLIADTIIYEILPKYKSLQQRFSAILNIEVLVHGSN